MWFWGRGGGRVWEWATAKWFKEASAVKHYIHCYAFKLCHQATGCTSNKRRPLPLSFAHHNFMANGTSLDTQPTTHSYKYPTDLRRRNFANKHRLSIQKSAPNVQKCACNVYMFRLSFHFACHCWWLGRGLQGEVFISGTS